MPSSRLFWLLPTLVLAGCVNFGLAQQDDPRAIVYYVLEDGGRPPAAAVAPLPRTLLLADTAAAAFYDTDGMAYSNEPGTRGYYQFARWSERSGKRFSDLCSRASNGNASSTPWRKAAAACAAIFC